MAKPNPQYPHGHNANDKRDESQYQEDKERLENEEKEDSIPKRSKN